MEIPYEVRDSEFGRGLFTTAFVPSGTLVWRYENGVNIREYDSQSASAHLATLSFQESQRFLDLTYGQRGLLCEVLDDGKYMNHSECPNCKTSTGGNTYAIRDIEIGEELYEDYKSFDHPDFLYPLLDKYECAPEYYELAPRSVTADNVMPGSPNFTLGSPNNLEEMAAPAM